MQDVNYIFRNSNYLLFFLFIILVTGTSCTPDTLWNMPIKTVKENLASSQYSFLKGINYKDKNMEEFRVLGPGAYYYLSSIYSYIGFPEYAKELLILSWKHEKKYWKEEAGFLLLQKLLEEKEYKLLEAYSLQYLKKIKKSKKLPAVKKLYIEALYWQIKDEAVLYSIGNFFPDKNEIIKENPEIMLFQAVSECRLNMKGWQNTFTEFFMKTESTGLHQRAYQFISLEKERFSAFDEGMQQFLLAKSFLGSGSPDFALPLAEYFLKYIDPEIITESTIIKELGLTYLSLGKYNQGLKILDVLIKKCTGKARLDAHEMAGRIARKTKRYAKAAQYLKVVMKETPDPEQQDRAAWFYLACVLEISPVRFIDEMLLYAKEWIDPVYFDDIIEKSISILIAGKKWEDLHYFFNSLQPNATNTIQIQIKYLSARLRILGYIKDEENHSKSLPEKYLQQLSKIRDKNYYIFLASSLLDKKPLYLKTESTAPEKINTLNRKTLSSVEEFVIGFFDFGLPDEGFTMLIKNIKAISTRVIFHAVTILNERGLYKKSIWLMNSIENRKDYKLSDNEIKYLYPQAYKPIIDLHAKKRGFDSSFFYALVREESAFDAKNASPVGAAGLTQLMPQTANDLAGWLRLDEYDLSDPETNILMGAYYYSRLLRLLENIPKTLISYNAGLGRLRDWEKKFKGLPIDLFVEAVPYRETRGYLKKIIVSACIYSYLYEKKPPYQVFSQLFPDMF